MEEARRKGQRGQEGTQKRESTRTEFGTCEDPFVEDDDARAQGDPQGNVEGRMESTAGAGGGLGRLGAAGLQPPVCLGGRALACHAGCRMRARSRSSCGRGNYNFEGVEGVVEAWGLPSWRVGRPKKAAVVVVVVVVGKRESDVVERDETRRDDDVSSMAAAQVVKSTDGCSRMTNAWLDWN